MMTKFTERSDVSFMALLYPEADRPKDDSAQNRFATLVTGTTFKFKGVH